MGRKRKQPEGAKPPEQIPLFIAEEPPVPPLPPPAQAQLAALGTTPTGAKAKIESPVFLEKIRVDAIEWASECGLKPPFMVNGPDRVNYPRYGHGYVLTIKEETGRERLGSARFNSDGARTYWSLDGIVTG